MVVLLNARPRDVERLRDVRVDLTIVGGRIVYNRSVAPRSS